MVRTLTHRYHRIPRLGKLLLGICFFFGVFLTTFKFMYADTIPFENQLTTMFSWLNTGYYSNAHFKYGGQNFVGIIFWQSGLQLPNPQEITINSGTVDEQVIECNEQLRGIYYNNLRGRRIWPLDTGNLAILSGYGLGYDIMTMDHGFFTDCDPVSGGYTPLANEVYGQLDHYLSGQTFRMIVGVEYNFTGNAIVSGSQFAPTLRIATGGIHTGFMFDTNGGIAELNMNTPWCQNFQLSPVNIPVSGDIIALCEAQNVNGYVLNIWASGGVTPLYTEIRYPSIDPSHEIRVTGHMLTTGDYFATCSLIGLGGTQGPSCGINQPFHVGSTGSVYTGGTGTCDPNYQGEISFSSSGGSSVINPSLGTYFTNRTGILIQLAATEPTQYDVLGNFTSSPRSGDYTGTSIFTPITNAIILTNTNGRNYFASLYTTGSCSYVDAAKRVYVDTQAPTAPSIITPSTGTNNICPTVPLNVARTASTDGSGSQLAYYKYEIYANSGMTTGMVLSGTTTATGTTVTTSLRPLGTYYMQIYAVDNVNNMSVSNIITFTTSQQYCGGGNTGIAIVTPTIWLRNVDLDTVYRSDPIRILGLTGPTLVTISKGMLFLNNNTGGNGTTGIVTSTDTLYIEMVSSNAYDTTVSSEIQIAGLTGAFLLTTKKNSCSLSAAEKLVIDNIYEELKDEYNNDLSKYSEFLNTFQSMVEDESDLSNSCTLDYLLSLIEDDFNTDGIDTSNHICPNCKEYSIGYDTNQKAYYAPEMMNRYYFINRESLIRHLDYYNPGDCHINTYGSDFRTSDDSDPMRHIAPNGKIYHLIGQYGGFSATEFATPKYFDSLQNIVQYIDVRNPAKEIWRHTINASFIPIVYAGPNGKEYRIYSTDRGFMSYKLMKVKYYPTLSDLKHHIDVNNPSRR